MLKRFRFGGQDSVTNPNPNIIRLEKITNPNPNIIRLEKNHESESEYSGFGGKDSNPNLNICIFATGHSLEPSVTSLRRILRNLEKYGTSVECGVKRALLSMSTSAWMTVWK